MRVLIADDHPVVRHGLRQMLAQESDVTVVGEARDGQEVIDLYTTLPWASVCEEVAKLKVKLVEGKVIQLPRTGAAYP